MFDGMYHDWNHKRIKLIIDTFSYTFFHGKTILDLGGGHGDIGAAFYRLGARVTVVDARAEHLKVATKKYSGINTKIVDLDKEWPFGHVDFILDLDLICHLKNFENHLRNACNNTNNIVLETTVCDSDNTNLAIILPENKDIYDASFNGFSARPTAAFIERIFTECNMEFKRYDSQKLNTNKKVYDWQLTNSNTCNENNRRFWIAKKIINTPSVPLIGNGIHTPALEMPTSPVYSLPSRAVPVTQPVPIQPTTVARLPFKIPPKVKSQSTKTKIRLFYNYYNEKNPHRKREIDFCLNKNIENQLFDLIIIESEQRPTFDFLFQKINQLTGPNDINIISNADIFFDNSIDMVRRMNVRDFYILNRFDRHENGSTDFCAQNGSQDAFICKGAIENVDGNFLMGMPGSAGRIAHEFQKAGYNVRNPSKSISIFHVHDSGIKNYTETDQVPEPYLIVDPSSF